MLLATHAAAICEAIAPTGCTVVGITVSAQTGDYGSIAVTARGGARRLTDAYLLADVGPGGIHAWRWATLQGWSVPSVDTAVEAMQRSGGVA